MASEGAEGQHHTHQFKVMRETTGGAVGGREQTAAQEVGVFDNREDANQAARGALNSTEFASVEVSESKMSGLAIVTGERADGNEEEVFVVEIGKDLVA